MEKNKKSSIILALILLSFFILIFLIVALIFLKLDSDNNNSNQIQNIVSDEESSIPYEPNLIDVLKEHNTEFLSQDGNTVYVSFDLAPEEEAEFSLTEFTKTALDFVCKSKIQLSCDSFGNIRLTKSKF